MKLVLLLALAGCAARVPAPGPGGGGGGGDARITLYRDGALVEETIAVEVAAGAGQVRVSRPRGVAMRDLAIAPAGGEAVRVVAWGVGGASESGRGGALPAPAAGRRRIPRGIDDSTLAIETEAPRAGRVRLVLRYLTDRITWQASYTLIDDRGRGRLHGALALRNDSGRSFAGARVAVLDRGMPSGVPTEAAFRQRAVEVPGLQEVRAGAQRVGLGLGHGALPLRATLVYDPVGSRLDSATMRPQMDEAYGVEPWPAAVDESVLIELSRVAAGPLPSGLVRVFTVGEGGAMVWRGEGRLLQPADDAERYTTVAVGRSPDVTGARRRTDYAIDHDATRLVEEITVTLHNAGARAADVLVREHLYRGQCWTLAFHSTGSRVAKEGLQQIGLGVTVPAGGEATVMYRVVYEWDPKQCRLSTSSN